MLGDADADILILIYQYGLGRRGLRAHIKEELVATISPAKARYHFASPSVTHALVPGSLYAVGPVYDCGRGLGLDYEIVIHLIPMLGDKRGSGAGDFEKCFIRL